jgi:hypothetical protein
VDTIRYCSEVLYRYPNTLLGIMFTSRKNHPLVKPDSNGEYFFDRNGHIFSV